MTSPSEHHRRPGRPWAFLAPGLVVLVVWFVVPVLRTIWLSVLDERGRGFVGLDNFGWVLDGAGAVALVRTHVVWLVGVTVGSTSAGLLLAALAHRMRHEKLVTTLVLVPAAVSFVAASVAWRLVYAYRPEGSEQIGLLNAAITAVGGPPVAWLVQEPVNDLFVVAIMVWVQTGVALVLLGDAIRRVPPDLCDAARIDGAGELQVFRTVTLPAIRGAIGVVVVTTAVVAVRVFDIVQVATGGRFGTQVVGTEFFEQAFRAGEVGRGAALAVVLLLAVVPMLVLHVRRVRREEAHR